MLHVCPHPPHMVCDPCDAWLHWQELSRLLTQRDDELLALREEVQRQQAALDEAVRSQNRADEVLMSKDQFILKVMMQMQEAGVSLPGLL